VDPHPCADRPAVQRAEVAGPRRRVAQCARRPAASTSTSAGRTARRPSSSVATSAPGAATYSTVTGVARDDLPDGGAWLYAETVRRIHQLNLERASSCSSPTSTHTRTSSVRCSAPGRRCSRTTSRPCRGSSSGSGGVPLRRLPGGAESSLPTPRPPSRSASPGHGRTARPLVVSGRSALRPDRCGAQPLTGLARVGKSGANSPYKSSAAGLTSVA
jgi:hypothetical protein